MTFLIIVAGYLVFSALLALVAKGFTGNELPLHRLAFRAIVRGPLSFILREMKQQNERPFTTISAHREDLEG